LSSSIHIEQEDIALLALYFAKDGKRYRSLGEKKYHISHRFERKYNGADHRLAETTSGLRGRSLSFARPDADLEALAQIKRLRRWVKETTAWR